MEGDSRRINKLLQQLDKAKAENNEKLVNKLTGQIRHHYRMRGIKRINVDSLLHDYKEELNAQEMETEGYQLIYDGYSDEFIWVHPDSEEALYYPGAFEEEDIVQFEPDIPDEEALQQKERLLETHGEPPVRRIFEGLELLKITHGQNRYGHWTLYIWKKESDLFKWFQANKKTRLAIGTIMNVKGTIKEYKYFNKKFDVMLSRCTLCDLENNVINPETIAVTRRQTQKKKKVKRKKRRKKKSIKCSPCGKIFSSTQARNQHFHAKHG